MQYILMTFMTLDQTTSRGPAKEQMTCQGPSTIQGSKLKHAEGPRVPTDAEKTLHPHKDPPRGPPTTPHGPTTIQGSELKYAEGPRVPTDAEKTLHPPKRPPSRTPPKSWTLYHPKTKAEICRRSEGP